MQTYGSGRASTENLPIFIREQSKPVTNTVSFQMSLASFSAESLKFMQLLANIFTDFLRYSARENLLSINVENQQQEMKNLDCLYVL